MICIHGHFYQPPRENPWTGKIDLQPSAAPFHDWNARIEAECYGPNGAARILADNGRVASLVNNYKTMSFNFGPTLIDWLAMHAPWTYSRVVAAADNAIAQAYNHAIMPLLNARDKKTQVVWGLRNFEHHFGRKAMGMWLPEAAVDTASLEALAAAGIAFTILCERSAPKGVHVCKLPSGRSITLCVYDGPLSQAVAFDGLLKDGAAFAERMKAGEGFVQVATDGETYGHHHQFGEMALAFATQRIPHTSYNAYLAEHPPTTLATIKENTSWSCEHGVERWRSNCGCHAGRHGDSVAQAWRAPLRHALDFLRDEIATAFDRVGSWDDRDRYIDVMLGAAFEGFRGPQTAYEAQKYAMYMYTSCGWFFDDVDDIETRQVLAYAARALELSEVDVRDRFLRLLDNAQSSLGEYSAQDVFLEVEATQSLPVRLTEWRRAPQNKEAAMRVLQSARAAKLDHHQLREAQALYQESGLTIAALAERLGFD